MSEIEKPLIVWIRRLRQIGSWSGVLQKSFLKKRAKSRSWIATNKKAVESSLNEGFSVQLFRTKQKGMEHQEGVLSEQASTSEDCCLSRAKWKWCHLLQFKEAFKFLKMDLFCDLLKTDDLIQSSLFCQLLCFKPGLDCILIWWTGLMTTLFIVSPSPPPALFQHWEMLPPSAHPQQKHQKSLDSIGEKILQHKD